VEHGLMGRLFLLPATPASVANARMIAFHAAITGTLAAGRPAAFLDVDVLAVVVSELTGNAVTHGTGRVIRGLRSGPRFLVDVTITDDGVQIAVTDSGHTDTAPNVGTMPGPEAESGRGLALIEALTGRPVETKQIGAKSRVTALIPWRLS
jgi:anti-sigma regulatory factor (Ser/Thr protein kinase)